MDQLSVLLNCPRVDRLEDSDSQILPTRMVQLSYSRSRS